MDLVIERAITSCFYRLGGNSSREMVSIHTRRGSRRLTGGHDREIPEDTLSKRAYDSLTNTKSDVASKVIESTRRWHCAAEH
jgi:hypothetical protein